MSVQRQIGFWLAAVAVVALGLYILREVLLPFVAGMALAYMLDPVADRLERLGLGRLGATILILALSSRSSLHSSCSSRSLCINWPGLAPSCRLTSSASRRWS